MTLSAIGIGLNLALLPILKYTTKYNAVEGFVVAILIFCPLLYNLLSIGKLTLNGLYLYSLLAIVIYTYVSKKIGSVYFLLTAITILCYVYILTKHLSLVFIGSVFLDIAILYLLTMWITALKIKKIIKASLLLLIMISLENVFNHWNPLLGSNSVNGLIMSLISASVILLVVDYVDRYLNKRQNIIEELELQANKDQLTNLYNLYHLNKNLEINAKNQTMTAIAVIDLDNFKLINDTYGHIVGNDVLVMFSEHVNQYLSKKLGSGKFDLYRYGGEEFVITFYTLNRSATQRLFNDMQTAISQLNVDNLDLQLSFSGGVAFFADYYQNAISTLKAADELLYLAKQSGRRQTIIKFDKLENPHNLQNDKQK